MQNSCAVLAAQFDPHCASQLQHAFCLGQWIVENLSLDRQAATIAGLKRSVF